MFMDIFEQDAFKLIAMTDMVERVPYVPQLLGSMGIFGGEGIIGEIATIEARHGTIALIPFTPRGSPPTPRAHEKRLMLPVRTLRLAHADTVQANELMQVRAWGSENRLMAVQDLMLYRSEALRQNIELTLEHQRMGAINGILPDDEGNTVFDWFDYMGFTRPATIFLDLEAGSPTPGDLQLALHALKRSIVRSSGGMITENVPIIALCGDAFYDALVTHPDVREVFLQAAPQRLMEADVWQTFRWGGIDWINYRSTDDGGATPLIGVPTNLARIFPRAPSIFKHFWGSGEDFETVNTIGRPLYANTIRDRDRNRWVQMELFTYPLTICTRPEVLRTASLATS